MAEKKPATLASDSTKRDLSQVLGTAPPGAWVALSQDQTRVVGTGVSMQAATYQARLHGEASPVLIQMPCKDEEITTGAR